MGSIAKRLSSNISLRNCTLWNALPSILPGYIYRISRPSSVPITIMRESHTQITADLLARLQSRSTLNPSPRTPRMNTAFNFVDKIERFLQQDNHHIWGFVIYRCTYRSNSEWDKSIKCLHASIESSLRSYNGLDMLDSLGFTIFDDQSMFDGASTSVIREHFKQWAATASQQEQNTGPAQSQRYQFCIQVNDGALDSVIAMSPEDPEHLKNGFVNLIFKDWEPYSSYDGDNVLEETQEPIDDPQEPIEGCTLYDVGWMKVRYHKVMVTAYCYLRDDIASWEVEYRRPPEIMNV